MNAEKFVAAVERFFLDIIGTILPGLALLGGMWTVFGPVRLGRFTLAPPQTETAWTLTIVLAYVLGHALTSLGERVVVPCAARLKGVPLIKVFTGKFDSDDNIVLESKDFQALAVIADDTHGKGWRPTTADEIRGVRNTAITIASAQAHTLHRFTFISLLNLGVATALWVTGVMLVTVRVVRAIDGLGSETALADAARSVGIGLLFGAVLLLLSLPFLERRFDFYRRTMHSPFSMAVAVLHERKEVAGVGTGAVPSTAPVVYLAGGTVSNWQDQVITKVPGARYLDPRKHGLVDPKAYTAWDLAAIRTSDIVLVYLEAAHPGGFALALQVGYAKALGKHVALVDEKTAQNLPAAPYLRMVSETADAVFPSLADGITYLVKRLELM